MKRIITCPNCKSKLEETYYTESWIGVVESHAHCDKCGFVEEFCYGSYYCNFDGERD